MSKKGRGFTISETYCVKCKTRGISIPRVNGQYREPGHLKKLYCLNCREETNHVEIRPFSSDYNYEDFELEQKYHNFTPEGERITPYRIFRGELRRQHIAP